jgi:enoyl-CoA hydratase/carnithine racemase
MGITGHCPAGGTVLAIHADYRVMAAGEFRLGLNEVQVGLFPGPVIHGAFRRLVGGHAAQLLTRGALIDPPTALRMGLVDELCEASHCAVRAVQVARELAALPRDAMLQTRALAREDLKALFGAPDDAERLAQEFASMGAQMFSVPATRERLAKMFAKRKPG